MVRVWRDSPYGLFGGFLQQSFVESHSPLLLAGGRFLVASPKGETLLERGAGERLLALI